MTGLGWQDPFLDPLWLFLNSQHSHWFPSQLRSPGAAPVGDGERGESQGYKNRQDSPWQAENFGNIFMVQLRI